MLKQWKSQENKMIIDDTVSSFCEHLKKATFLNQYYEDMIRLNNSIARRKRSRFPNGIYDSKQEHSEFRQLYIREFLDRNHLDSDVDLKYAIVFWKNGDIVAVGAAPIDDSQSTSELLELLQN